MDRVVAGSVFQIRSAIVLIVSTDSTNASRKVRSREVSTERVVNDKFRALDRSGKPCKKWAKGSVQVNPLIGSV